MTDSDRGARPPDAPSLPRRSQYLAIPLGGLAPAHRERSALVRLWHQYSAAVLVSGIGMSARSAGAPTIGGLPAVGRCEPASPETATRHEHCTFTLGSTSLTSEDVFDGHTRTWRRAYSDGDVVVFSVDGDATPVPIPLPVGR